MRAGQALATVESNLSLTNYTVTAPISGVVLARNASVGAVAGEGTALFEIADLSSLWVDLHMFGADAQHIRPGVPVKVTRMSDGVTVETVLERVLPGTATASQSTVARATIRQRRWPVASRFGGEGAHHRRAAACRSWWCRWRRCRPSATGTWCSSASATPTKCGRSSWASAMATQVEILSGLKAGDQVVVEQSYLVKADIEKSGASHDH